MNNYEDNAEEFDCDYTQELVCPYCGYEFTDSGEYRLDGEELISCPECDKEFYGGVNIEVTYYTEKAKYGTCSICGKKDVVVEDIDYHNEKAKSVGVNCCHHDEYWRLVKIVHDKWDKEKKNV